MTIYTPNERDGNSKPINQVLALLKGCHSTSPAKTEDSAIRRRRYFDAGLPKTINHNFYLARRPTSDFIYLSGSNL